MVKELDFKGVIERVGWEFECGAQAVEDTAANDGDYKCLRDQHGGMRRSRRKRGWRKF